MFKIKIAGLTVGIDNKYPYIETLCEDYFADGNTDFDICVTEAEIAAEKTEDISDPGYLESLAVYRKIAERLPDYDGFLMHGVVLKVDGEGYAFTAPSGTGKTTHAMYWKKLFGDRCIIVNGDKPLIRFIDGEFRAYGTPWCGKENLHTNTSAPLRRLFCVNRSAENRVVPLDPKTSLTRLLAAVYRPKDPALFEKTAEYIMLFLKKVAVCDLFCNMSVDAAKCAYNAAKEK